jgi:hypothetical protein
VQVDGLVVVEDFIDQAAHDELWRFFTDPERNWEDTLSRRVQHYASVCLLIAAVELCGRAAHLISLSVAFLLSAAGSPSTTAP